MQEDLSCFAVCSYNASAILIAGGWNTLTAVNKCYLFCTDKAEFTRFPEMTVARRDFALVDCENVCYAIGGDKNNELCEC